MKEIKLLLCVCVLVLLGVVLMSCGTQNTPDYEKKTLRVTHMESMKPILDATKAIMEEKGYTVELVLMDANVNTIKSVNDSSADAAMAVHKGFMESFNRENNGDLVMVEPYSFSAGLGLYSEKHESLEDFPDNARIAIMNDPMNMSRCLTILENHKLIELNKDTNGNYSLIDIVGNPKNIEIIEMDQIQTVRSMEDLDGAFAFFGHMRNAGKDWRTFIVRDADSLDFPMAFVVKEENKDAVWAKDLAEAIREQPVRTVVLENFDGIYEYFE